MSITVFIDGGHGTTGLEIRERLSDRDSITLIELDDAHRKDANARLNALQSAEIAILCLPDDAAKDAVAMLGDRDTRLIDTSSAHRVNPDWVYGFPEIEADRRSKIAAANRVSNPGCYAATFVALVRPLIRAGIISSDARLSVNATSGYSGGGKAMIAEFESGDAGTAFRNYALGLSHKHLPEMRDRAGLDSAPLFSPSVTNVHRGMIVEVPLSVNDLQPGKGFADVSDALTSAYQDNGTVSVIDESVTAAMALVPIERLANTDRMEIFVFSNREGDQIRLCGVLDNLGKGASGMAVQSLNLMAGFDEFEGLRL